MVRTMNTTSGRRLFAASMLGTALVFSAPAAANSYLDALKAEATSDTRPQNTQTLPRDDGRPTPRTDDQIQMEEWLQQEFMGSYVFYLKLSDSRKMAVYRAYRAGAPIGELRDKINELLKQ